MKRSRLIIAVIAADAAAILLTAALAVLYAKLRRGALLVSAITLGVIAYNFVIRLIIGETVTLIFRRLDFGVTKKRRYAVSEKEMALYEKLNVRAWKKNLLTAKPEQFDIRANTPETIIKNMCQAETVHKISMLFAFVPAVLIPWAGVPAVFILTGVFSSFVDLPFVLVQRYNRARMVKLLLKKRKE